MFIFGLFLEIDKRHVIDKLAKRQDDFLDKDEKWDDYSIFMLEKAVNDIISYFITKNSYSKKNQLSKLIAAQGCTPLYRVDFSLMCVLMWGIEMKCLYAQGAHTEQGLEHSYLRWRTV
ncbi:MAG: hypothetical protein EZS28_024174 [Streblomastix strix]|uniref:Uncharacterized protein n=1 Tax=Streblomastix strix TaxID=222440 RepID=A0A5J4VCQ1_9EUKA|nr:MAG: hypothetical protein EZS28_024174 [Streblomastix strix]